MPEYTSAIIRLSIAAMEALNNCREDAEKIRGKVSGEVEGRIVPFDQFVKQNIPFDVYWRNVGSLHPFPWSEVDIVASYRFSVLDEYRDYVEHEMHANDPGTIL